MGHGKSSRSKRCADLVAAMRAAVSGNPITSKSVAAIFEIVQRVSDQNGKPLPEIAAELTRMERDCAFTSSGARHFQDMLGRLGVDSSKPIGIPANHEPFWFRCDHPLKNYRSQPQLPNAADIVIIGAGLTGASAAYHLREAEGVVVLDKGSPAGEASGRNGGNFELLPENSVGIYEGLSRERLLFLRHCYPHLPTELLRIEAERQASLVLGFALRNRDLLKQIIERENIDCDFSPKGWLYLAHTEKEEQAVCEEVLMAAEQGQRVEIWSRLKIRQEFGFDRQFIGRFIPGDGTYHPFKFVYGTLQLAVDAGVKLYTGVKVLAVNSHAESVEVVTGSGTVHARSVIVATNAFTSELFPELKAIRAAQSQISITEFAPDRCGGRAVTSEEGPAYFNQPREGARGGLAPLLMGGGADRSMQNPSSRRRSPKIHASLLALREKFYPELKRRPFSTEWVGPIAFTPDQLPAVGFLRPGVIVAAGYNGYGGSYTVAAGQAAASMALTGQAPDWLPQDVFSPARFASREPLFLSETNGLWRIASSLCAQLRSVDRQISDALVYSSLTRRRTVVAIRNTASESPQRTAPGSTVDPEQFRALPEFSNFERQEAEELLRVMRRCDLVGGTVLFHCGSPGRSCFVILNGEVDVTVQIRGQEQLLARLHEGSIFGQVALIEGCPRTATCIAHRDSVLLELDREPCEKIFAARKPLAYKLLAALNQGLISALRGADRQLMKLTEQNRVTWSAKASDSEHASDETRAYSPGTAGAQAKATILS